jgi:hypothetical protein
MKAKFLTLAAAAMMIFASCSTNQNTAISSTARTLELETPALVADLEVEKTKVTGEFKFDCPAEQPVNEQELKDNAVFNALKTMNADVLVAPQYQIIKESKSRKYYTVIVTGYPAFYRNFRPMPIERVTNMELKEVNGMIFVITKNNFNETVGYQIVVPNDKKVQTIEAEQTLLDKLSLDQVVLDQVILKAREQQNGAKVTTSDKKQEKEGGFLSKVVKSAKKKAKKAKK